MKVVSNSTPLVHLSAIEQLNLLQQLFQQIYIPKEVYEEVVVRGAGKPGADAVSNARWIHVESITNRIAYAALNAVLGQGESACIVLSLEIGADLVILDDRLARLHAQSHNLRVIGTVGVLLMADQKGLLDFPQCLDALLASGFRLSHSEYQRVLDMWKQTKGH